MPPAPHRNRGPGSLEVAATVSILAVFAADLATTLPLLAAILPLLPPITRNIKFPDRPNRLEYGIRDGSALETKLKSGKNGNVDRAGQL